MQHPNARHTERGRLDLVLFVGARATPIARRRVPSLQRVHGLRVGRALEAGLAERAPMIGLPSRSLLAAASLAAPHGRAHPGAHRAGPPAHRVGPGLVAGELGMADSSVWKVLHRHGLSRPAPAEREPVRRYEWPCPGDLLHMDTKRYARFEKPGHALTGIPIRTRADKRARVGYQYAHCIVDDHSRLAYVELHGDGGGRVHRLCRAGPFLVRAKGRLRAPAHDRRRLVYTRNRSLICSPARRRHLYPPLPTQTNGSRALPPNDAREGLRMLYLTYRHRQEALRYWICHYNERRPHSALALAH